MAIKHGDVDKKTVTGRLSIIFALSMILTACGGPSTWYRAETSRHNMENDLAKCRYEIRMNKIPEDKVQKFVADCMQAKGYRWR